MKQIVAITGASGFIGHALIRAPQLHSNYHVIALCRSTPSERSARVEYRICGGLGPNSDASQFLSNTDAVVHIAARTQVTREAEADTLSAYREINVEGCLNLARRAAELGVKRFIFLSSIKVNGETAPQGRPFRANDTPNPQDAYGISKMEAELGLLEITRETGMEVVCIRPPLVYGPGVKGNFLSLLMWLERGIPLPLGSIYNQRSFVGIDNLVDLIITCLEKPAAANQTFLVSDDEDVSTTELLLRMRSVLNKPTPLLPLPPALLKLGARMIGKTEIAQRLLGDLQIDISKTKELLGWSPPVNFDDGLRKTVEWYFKQR